MEISYNHYIGTLTIQNDETTFHTYKLHNEILNAIDYLSNCVTKKEKEIERLHSIIKEAREYIVKNTDNTNFIEVPVDELISILDKVEEK